MQSLKLFKQLPPHYSYNSQVNIIVNPELFIGHYDHYQDKIKLQLSKPVKATLEHFNMPLILFL
jgi:hypothetical protein